MKPQATFPTATRAERELLAAGSFAPLLNLLPEPTTALRLLADHDSLFRDHDRRRWQEWLEADERISGCERPTLRALGLANWTVARRFGASWLVAQQFEEYQLRRTLATPETYEASGMVCVFPPGDEVRLPPTVSGRRLNEGPMRWRRFADGIRRYAFTVERFYGADPLP